MNGASVCRIWLENTYFEIGAEFLFEVWIAKRSHNLTFSSRVFTFSHDHKLVFDVTYCESAINYLLHTTAAFFFPFYPTTILLLNRDALSQAPKAMRIWAFSQSRHCFWLALLHPPFDTNKWGWAFLKYSNQICIFPQTDWHNMHSVQFSFLFFLSWQFSRGFRSRELCQRFQRFFYSSTCLWLNNQRWFL